MGGGEEKGWKERRGGNWVGMGRWIGIHVGVALKKVGEKREV